MQLFVRVSATLRTARYVVQIIDAFNTKRDMLATFNES